MIVGKLTVILGLDSKGFTTGINSATGKTTAFAKATDKTFKAISKAAKIGMLAVGAAFVKGAVDAAKFEKALANVSTMLDKNTMPMMKDFEKGILNMSEAYGESTDTLAKGLYDILSASIPASKALDVLDISAKAAKAGLTDTGVAADAITTLMNSFGDASKDAGYYADILFSTVKLGKTTFAELGPSIGQVASLFSLAGGTAEEMGGMLAVMTAKGLDTRVAITSLKGVVSALIDPTDELTTALGGMTVEADGFRAVMDKVGSLEIEDLTKMFPNVRALTGIATAANGVGDAVDRINQLMADGSPMMIAFDKNMSTFAATWDRFKATLKATSITIGNELLPIMKQIFEDMIIWFQDNRENFAKFARDTLEGIRKLVGIISSLKEILLGAGAAILGMMVLSKVTPLMKAFGIATSVSMGPVGLIAVSIGLLVGAFFKLKAALRANRDEQELLDAATEGSLNTTEEYNKAIDIQWGKVSNLLKMRQEATDQYTVDGELSAKWSAFISNKYDERIADENALINVIVANAAAKKKLDDAEKKRLQDEELVALGIFYAEQTRIAESAASEAEKAALNRQLVAEEKQRIEDLETAKEKAAEAEVKRQQDKADAYVDFQTNLFKLTATEEELWAVEKARLEDIGATQEEILLYYNNKYPEAVAEATETVKMSWKGFTEYLEDNWVNFMDSMVSSFNTAMNSVMDLWGLASEAEIAAVEEKYAVLTQAELDYQAFMDSEAEQDKKDQLDKLADLKKQLVTETDAIKKAELVKQIANLETNILEKKLADDAATARIAADEKAASEILKIKQDQAKKEKKMRIAMAIIDTAAAIIHSLWDPGGFAGVALAVAAGITGALQIATIAAQPIPMITGGLVDNMISGGAVRGTPGIDTNNVALTNREYVMPPQQSMDNLEELESMRAGEGGKNITIMPAQVDLIMNDQSVGTAMIQFITDESDLGSFRMNPKVLAGTT